MKGMWKRIVAGVCVFSMITGSALTYMPNMVRANNNATLKDASEYLTFGKNDTHLQISQPLSTAPNTIEVSVKAKEEKEWTLMAAGTDLNAAVEASGYEQTATTGQVSAGEAVEGLSAGTTYSKIVVSPRNTSTNTGGQFGFRTVKYEGIKVPVIPNRYRQSDLAVAFWMYSAKNMVLPRGGFALASGGWNNDSEIRWSTQDNINLQAGWNYVELSLDQYSTEIPDGSGNPFDYEHINFARWYTDGAYLTEETEFRLTDIKLIAKEVEDIKEDGWVLRSGHNKTWTWYGLSNNAISYKATSATDAPGAGVKYAELTLDANDQFGFENNDFSASIPSAYKLEDLALSFWFYSANGVSPKGQIRLSSSGTQNTNYIYWNVEDFDDGFKVGWNQMILPFSQNKGIWNLDITGLNYLRWHETTAVIQETVCGISDISVVLLEKDQVQTQEWTLLSANSSLKEAADHIVTNADFNYKQTVSTGTVSAEEATKNLPVGTSYTKIVTDPSNGRVGFLTKWQGITPPTLPEDCKQENLKIAYWLYSSTGKMPNGGIILSSSGWVNPPALRWWVGDKIKIQPGWNYIELSLNNYSEKQGEFDYKNINFMQMYSDGAYLTEETEFRIADVKLIYTPEKKETTPVVITEGVDATTLEKNNMIFSNTNVTGENAYALFLTRQGYPALLWGNTQYTLKKNVRTDQFTTIKVVKNNEGYIEFYLNGSLAGTSKIPETDALGSFATAHRIGADGNGGQTFEGTLANLAVYSDITGDNCMGNWPLEGDIQYILETMSDTSGNNNTAVYRGQRAEDWLAYDDVKETAIDYVGEDYWSMVFIPDMQKVTVHDDSYSDTWDIMAQWIGDNVETEKIQHVIGAGDTADNNLAEQYERAVAGYEKFWNKVSWSNMVGNHDYDRGATVRDSSRYQTYFGRNAIENTKAKETYVGSYEDSQNLSDTENSYYRFEINNVRWMILQLEYHPRMEVIQWADKIIKEYPNDNVILMTHSYLSGIDGYQIEYENYIHDADGSTNIESTEEIWTELKDNSNIKMILCGHSTNGTGAIVQKNEVNEADETVPALMINAQDMDRPGAEWPDKVYYTDRPLGMLSILRFSADGSKATIQYYAPQDDMCFSPTDLTGERNSNAIQLAFRVEENVQEYKIYSSDEGESITSNDGNLFFLKNDANLQLPDTATMDNLSLSIEVTLKDADAVAAMKNSWVELTNKLPDEKELCWSLADQPLSIGKNVIKLKLTDATPYFGNATSDGYGAFTLDEKIDCFRIYGSGAVKEDSVKLHKVKLLEEASTTTVPASSGNRVPRLFSSGMMFQQNKPMNIWGYGTAGDVANVYLYKGSELVDAKQATIGQDGRWDVALDARKGSYDTYSIDIWVGSWNYAFGDIVIGELWVAGGQSNMELTVSTDMDSNKILANANDRYMRMFLYPNASIMRPIEEQDDVKNAWWGYGSNSNDVANTSSVAYHFAQKLREELDVPVGIINTPKGGTVIESWLSLEAVKDDTKVQNILQQYDLYYGEAEWSRKAGLMSTLYNQRIAPLEGMNVAGTIWYQGESNSDRSEIYDVELALLKASWGSTFGFEDGKMPLIFTQVAPYSYDNGRNNQQHLGYLAMYMERGFKLCDTDTTAMLTVYDLPLEHMKEGVSSDPIHPRQKAEVGARFANAALNMVYGGNEEYTAPVYKNKTYKGNAIYITFDYVGNGLKTTDGSDDVHGFTIAGPDGVYVNAKAEFVNKNTIKVWNDRVVNPQEVMYAFDNYNQGANLCNSSMIPAAPFRTVTFDDTTLESEVSLHYFTAQDWMYADKDVWVYDSTNTANANTGYRPSFKVEGGSYSYDSDIYVEGTAALKVTYEDDFSLSPIVSYESVKQDWSKFKRLSVSVLNPNEKDAEITMTITSGGQTYTVATVEGEDSVKLAGSSEEFMEIAFDLTALKLNGTKVSNAEEVLAGLTDITFDVKTSGVALFSRARESRNMYFDAFAVGMTDNILEDEEELGDTAPDTGEITPGESAPQGDSADKAVNTGDSSHIGWYLILFALTGTGIVFVSKRTKREE